MRCDNDVEGALQEFDEAIKADPKSVSAAVVKVDTLVRQKRTGEAIKFAESIVKAEPSNIGFRSLLASLYVRDRQFEKARAAYQEAAKLAPKAAGPQLGLARVALAQQKDEEAIRNLQAVVKAQPDHPERGAPPRRHRRPPGPLRSRGLDAGRIAQGGARSKRPWRRSLAEVYVRAGRFDDAIARATQILAQNPEMPGVLLIRAQAYMAKRDGESAMKDLATVVRLNPKEPAAHYFLARGYAVQGRIPEAQAAYREALKLNPNLGVAKEELAALSGQKPDPAGAQKRIAALRAAVEKDPKSANLREALANALLVNGDVAGAEPHFKAVLESAPNHLGANLQMARIRLQQGKADEAETYLRGALRGSPESLEANVWLGRHLVSRGRREEGLRHLETALRVNPNHGRSEARGG